MFFTRIDKGPDLLLLNVNPEESPDWGNINLKRTTINRKYNCSQQNLKVELM